MAFLTLDSTVSVGPLQYECLCALWILGASDVVAIRAVVNKGRALRKMPELAYTTILTVVRNMHRRGIVERRAGVGLRHAYRPIMDEDTFNGELARQFLGAYFGGDLENMKRALAHRSAEPAKA